MARRKRTAEPAPTLVEESQLVNRARQIDLRLGVIRMGGDYAVLDRELEKARAIENPQVRFRALLDLYDEAAPLVRSRHPVGERWMLIDALVEEWRP